MTTIMAGFLQVSITVDRRAVAERIARKLLEERLASCVQVLGPIDSNFWWKNKIRHAREWLCLIKASANDYRKIETAIKKMHPYDVPEILAFTILRGNPDYLHWMRKETDRRAPRQN